VTDFLTTLESSDIAVRIAETWWFPLIESIHVVGIVMTVGAILMVDLRLLGVAARSYAVSRMSKELVPWTWAAFVLSVITGVGLFITRANHYFENPAFRIKALLLVLAGINMAIFHFGIARRLREWDEAAAMPLAAKCAAAVSLVAWSGVMLAGRWIGHLS
jgi:hypothetical protein